jgi:hypothetical protein
LSGSGGEKLARFREFFTLAAQRCRSGSSTTPTARSSLLRLSARCQTTSVRIVPHSETARSEPTNSPYRRYKRRYTSVLRRTACT